MTIDYKGTKSKDSLSMTMLMTPDMANFSGNVHGGALLKILDQVAYACASHFCKHYVVTLSVDQVHFREPVKVGELVSFYSSVNYVGRSTMEIGVKVVAEDIHTGIERHTNSCYFTMVAVDENGKSTTVPRLELNTPQDKARYIAAALRKQLRSEHDQRLKDIHDKWTEHVDDLSPEELDESLKEYLESTPAT